MKVSDKFLMDLKRSGYPAGFDVGVGLGQARINDATLGRCVFAVGAGELRAVNQEFRSNNDFAALKSGFDQVAFGNAGQGTQPNGQRHLTFAVYFYYRGHGPNRLTIKSRTFQLPWVA
jgi:hypothetical protein